MNPDPTSEETLMSTTQQAIEELTHIADLAIAAAIRGETWACANLIAETARAFGTAGLFVLACTFAERAAQPVDAHHVKIHEPRMLTQHGQAWVRRFIRAVVERDDSVKAVFAEVENDDLTLMNLMSALLSCAAITTVESDADA